MSTRTIRGFALLGVVLLCSILYLGLKVIVLTEKVRELEVRTSIQVGMSLAEAKRSHGGRFRVVQSNELSQMPDVPAGMRGVSTGHVVLFSKIWPSSYVWVHVNAHGIVDMVVFHES